MRYEVGISDRRKKKKQQPALLRGMRSFDCAPFVPLAQDDNSQRRERKELILSFPRRRCTCFLFLRRCRHSPPAYGEG